MYLIFNFQGLLNLFTISGLEFKISDVFLKLINNLKRP